MRYFGIFLYAGLLCGQTQIDLRTQSRDVDFSAFIFTRPVKTGTVLPATCGVGDLFFKSNASNAGNLFGCTTINTWSVLSGGALTTDVQSGSTGYCADTGSAGSYVCSLTPPISAYTLGMMIQLRASASNSGAATLNVNGLGTRPILKNKDQTLTANDIKAGQMVTLVYDGANFEMQSQLANYIEAGPSGGIKLDRTVFPWTIDVETSLICFKNGACAPTGTMDLSGALATKPSRQAATDPATCSEGESYYNTTLHKRRDCTGTNIWTDAGLNAATAGFGYFSPFGWPTTSSSATQTINSPIYYQITLPYTIKVRSLVFGSQGLASGKAFAAGIYDSSCNLITGASGTVVGAAGAGAIRVPLSVAVTLSPGVYYEAWATEDTAASINLVDSGASSLLLNAGGDARVFRGSGAVSGTGASYALPASCGSKTPGQIAVAGFVWLP